VSSLEQAVQLGPFDAAIFALKSFDTGTVLEAIVPFVQSMPPVICFQNGVENEARLASILGNERVIAGTVTSAVSRRAAGDITLERSRGIGLSSLHPLAHTFANAFTDARLNTHLYAHPAAMKWSKMLTNLVGNATSAILDLPPAQVFAHPLLYDLEIRQLRETLRVMRAHGISMVNLPKMPVRWLGLALQHFHPKLLNSFFRRAVGGGRGEKMPSLYIDLHSGRKQSEVDYLNGAVARYGQAAGIPTPVNTLLCQTLLKLIDGSLPRERFTRQPQALLELLAG
jgi:2-dehydropantoate 2-reductase